MAIGHLGFPVGNFLFRRGDMIKKIRPGRWEKQKQKAGQKDNIVWLVDIHLGIERIRRKFETYEEAKKYHHILKGENAKGDYIPNLTKDRTPFDVYAKEYYQRITANREMVNPHRNEKYRISHFIKFFKNTPLSAITQRMVEKWKIETLNERKCKPSTFNRSLTSLKALYNKAIEDKKIKLSPAANVKKVREENPETRFLTEKEIETLFELATPRLCNFILLGLNTGLRLMNLSGLKWEDVDLEHRAIHLRKTKTGLPYTVKINNAANDLLARLRKTKTGPFVLDTTNHRREWERAKKLAGFCFS